MQLRGRHVLKPTCPGKWLSITSRRNPRNLLSDIFARTRFTCHNRRLAEVRPVATSSIGIIINIYSVTVICDQSKRDLSRISNNILYTYR